MTAAGSVRRAAELWPVPVWDVVISVGLVAMALASTTRQQPASHPWTDFAAVLTVGPTVLRTRAPVAMAILSALGLTAYALLPGSATPLWTFVAIPVVCFSVGANLDGRRRLGALGVLLAAAYVLQLSSTDRAAGDDTFSEIWVSPLVILGGPAFAGALLRRSRRQNSELRRVTAELEAERSRHAELAASAERRRIARELHDVISHSVSVMVVQAGAAEQLLASDAPARGPVQAVRETGKEALAELRRQLGLLDDPQGASPAPLPGLDDLRRLTAQSGASLDLRGRPLVALPPGLELTVYRVVQEALTNAQRHSPGTSVCVSVCCLDHTIDIVVENNPSPGQAAGLSGSGSGLRGMAERVAMYGGRLEFGPSAGGWRVHACLPISDHEQDGS